MQEKSRYEYVHSVRIELAKLILVGTRITYQATGDTGFIGTLPPLCADRFEVYYHPSR